MKKLTFVLAVCVFSLVPLVHSLGAFFGVMLEINGWHIPRFVNLIVVFSSLVIAWSFWYGRR